MGSRGKRAGKAAAPEAACQEHDLLAELRASEERYRQVSQTAVDAIITADQDGTVLTWNQAAQHMFGYGQEMVGRSVVAIIPERYRQAHEEGVRRYLSTGQRRIIGQVAELAALRRDGGEFPIELSLSTWRSAQGVCFGAIVRDISERKRVERLREDVQRMIRHDLKSPLVGMVGMANLLLKTGGLDERQTKAAHGIRDLGQRLLGFIQRSRDIFQLEEGRYQIKPQTLDLLALVGRVEAVLRPLAQSRRLGLRVVVRGRKPRAGQRYLARGEEGLMEVLLENLIKNALEAAPPDSLVRVEMGPGKQGGHLIAIHNPGAIPPEIRDRFFEPYVTSGKRDGTGLGTHSARLIARAHGGELTFTTSEAEGTSLLLTLPA